MFRHPAWAVGSYRSGPPAAGSAGTKSTGGFFRPEWSPYKRPMYRISHLHGGVVLRLDGGLRLQLGDRRPHRVNVLRKDPVLSLGYWMWMNSLLSYHEPSGMINLYNYNDSAGRPAASTVSQHRHDLPTGQEIGVWVPAQRDIR